MEERLVGRSWEEWEHELSTKADGTRRNYLNGMKRLIEHHDFTTEELYKMHLDNTRSEDPRDAKIVPRMVLNLVRDLVDSGELKSSSARSIADGVSSFFRANMVPFVLNGGLPPLDKEGKERMTRDQIKALLEATGSYRNKSLITMMKDTGLRESDIANLRVKHVLPAIRGNLKFHAFTIRQEKTKFKADPVIGPDAIKYLKLWWRERGRFGLGEDPESYVYCVLETKPSWIDKRGRKGAAVRAGNPMRPATISNIFYNLITKVGLRGANISGHSLRKTHETMLAAGGVPESWIDKMTGRVIPGSKGPYVKPDSDQLTEFYAKAYSGLALDVLSETSIKMVKTLEEDLKVLQSENAGLLARIDHLESRLGTPQALIEALREAGLVTTLPQKEA